MNEHGREGELRGMKRRATGLLVAVSALFVAASIATDGDGWSGYLIAATEAAMVGGIADWFAVTALFKYPLGLRIPHTAIIPNRKDQIGRSLGEFVQDNFLHDDLLAERMHEFGPAERIGAWFAQPVNAARVGGQATAVISAVEEIITDDEVAEGLEDVVARRIEAFDLAPLAARAMNVAIEGGHHQAAFDAAVRAIDAILVDNTDELRARLRQESPWWVPEVIDDRVFAKLSDGVRKLCAEILADPDHELRHHVDARAADLANRLASSPELARRVEAMKMDLIDHPEVRAWLGSLWGHIKQAVVAGADDPDSELRARIENAVTHAGRSLAGDPALQRKLDAWLESAVRYVARQSQGTAADLIATTIARWDAEQTSRRLELQVGRDLQFIRINGTVVGGVAGIAIHALAGVL